MTPKENIVIPVVQEFYASFKDQEMRNAAIWETITVQGKQVHVTPKGICEFYNTPYYKNDFLENTNLTNFNDREMDNIINYLTEGRGEWNR